jgi:hypothetical protein
VLHMPTMKCAHSDTEVVLAAEGSRARGGAGPGASGPRQSRESARSGSARARFGLWNSPRGASTVVTRHTFGEHPSGTNRCVVDPRVVGRAAVAAPGCGLAGPVVRAARRCSPPVRPTRLWCPALRPRGSGPGHDLALRGVLDDGLQVTLIHRQARSRELLDTASASGISLGALTGALLAWSGALLGAFFGLLIGQTRRGPAPSRVARPRCRRAPRRADVLLCRHRYA